MSLLRTLILSDQGPTLVNPCNLSHFLRGLIAKCPHLGDRASAFGIRGNTHIQDTRTTKLPAWAVGRTQGPPNGPLGSLNLGAFQAPLYNFLKCKLLKCWFFSKELSTHGAVSVPPQAGLPSMAGTWRPGSRSSDVVTTETPPVQCIGIPTRVQEGRLQLWWGNRARG